MGTGRYRIPLGVAGIDISEQLRCVFMQHMEHGEATPQETLELACPFTPCQKGEALHSSFLKRLASRKRGSQTQKENSGDKLFVNLGVQFVEKTQAQKTDPITRR